MRSRLTVVAALIVATLALPLAAAAQLDPTCNPLTSTRLRLRKLDYPLGGQRLLFRGVVQIPAATVIDPAASGLRFRMTDGAGTVMSDITVPGGAPSPTTPGWTVSGAGNSWTYSDRQGTRGGLHRVLVRRSPSRPADTKVLLFGQEMSFAAPVGDVYVHTYLVADGGASVCGSKDFDETVCTYRNLGGKLNCH